MNEKMTTYAEVKHLPSKKQMQKEKIKEQLIYSEVKTYTSNSNQTKVTRTESSKEKGSSVPFTWFLAVVILGISCFVLLSTTGILGFMVFQGHQAGQPQKRPLANVTQEDNSTFKNVPCKGEPLNTGSESSTCERKWSCCGESCYYFSHEEKNFEDSKKFCKEMGSRLLRIENGKEQKFIESQLYNFYWIGLSRKGTGSPWTWEDGSLPLFQGNWKESENGNCARMAARNMAAADCSKFSYYICEKKAVCLAT